MEINVEGKKERKTMEELIDIIEYHTNNIKIAGVNKYEVGRGQGSVEVVNPK